MMLIDIDPNLPVDAQRKIINTHIEQISLLVQQAGWKVFVEFLRREEATAFEAMREAETGDLAMKASCAYVSIKKIRELPEESLRQAIEYLKQLH